MDYGFRAIISSSFADIFLNNCYQNGLLPVELDEADVAHIMTAALAGDGYEGFPNMCRCSFRQRAEGSECRPDIGFRVAFDE